MNKNPTPENILFFKITHLIAQVIYFILTSTGPFFLTHGIFYIWYLYFIAIFSF